MKAKLVLLVVGVAMVAAACSSSKSNGGTGPTTNVGAPLPANIKSKGHLTIGVKCDYPPFGYIDEGGKNAGFEIDLAHKMAQYAFGNDGKVSFTCVTGSNRVSFLDTKKIDFIMATMNYTPDRAKTIDFSTPYFDSGVKMLVPKDSGVSSFDQLAGKSVITIKGTTASIWLTQCNKDAHQLAFDQTSEALTALKQNRGVAFAQDDTLLVDLAAKNSGMKVVGDAKADSPWGMGFRKGDVATRSWVDGALKKMQQDDYFWTEFQKTVTDKTVQQQFEKFVPRPGNTLAYPTGPLFTC
jgi:polar amino acid transport system substrate-binding protein